MKPWLILLAVVGCVAVLALPSDLVADAVMAERSVDSSASFSVELHLKSGGDASNLEHTSHSAALIKRYGSAAMQKRDEQLNKRQSSNLVSGGGNAAEYYAHLAIGTPAQKLLLVVDTGSSDLWVMGKLCGASCSSSPRFESNTSTTFATKNVPYSMAYADDAVIKGKLASDTVSLASFSVPAQSFAVIESMKSRSSGTYLHAPASGLVGLSIGATSNGVGTPFWPAMASSGKLPSPVFTLRLQRRKAYGKVMALEPGGTLTVGVVDSKQYSGPITYVNLVSKSAWSIPLDSFTLDDKTYSIPQDENVAWIDSGSAENIAGPRAIVAEFFANIPGSQLMAAKDANGPDGFDFYSVPCKTNGSVKFRFGGRDFSVSPVDMFRSLAPEKMHDGQLRCRSALVGADLGNAPAWVMGTTFLTNVFAVFDGGFGNGTARIGLATPK